MAVRRPLVNVAGRIKELPTSDTLPVDGQVSIAYAATVTIDLSANPNVSIFDITLAGNIVIDFSNPVKNGQKILLRLTQDATGGRTVSFGTSIRVGTTLANYTATATALKTDILGFLYKADANKFDFVGVNKGY